MDTDKVNTYLKEMIEFREDTINSAIRHFGTNDNYVEALSNKLGTEINLLNLLQEEMIAKGTYNVCYKPPHSESIHSNGICSYDD